MVSSKGGFSVYVFFNNAGGISKNTPVVLSGMTIGHVKQLDLDYARQGVVVEILLEDNAKIPEDSTIQVNEKGMLGEMYLSFQFGKSAKMLSEGDQLLGNPPFVFSEMLSDTSGQFSLLSGDLQAILAKVRILIEKPGFSEDLETMVHDLRLAVGNFKEVSDNLKSEMGKLEETDLVSSMARAIQHIEKTAEYFAEGSNTLLRDANGMMGNLNSSSNQLQEAVDGLANLMTNLEKGEGSMGRLFKDPQLYDHLNELLQNATHLLQLLEEQPSSIIWGKKIKR